MAIVRKLNSITVTFDRAGNVAVSSVAIVSNDDEPEVAGGGWNKNWNAPQVKAAAEALRDQIVQQAAGQGKPLTF